MSKKQFPSFRVSAAPPLRGWREEQKTVSEFPQRPPSDWREEQKTVSEFPQRPLSGWREEQKTVSEFPQRPPSGWREEQKTVSEFPSFRSAPPQVGERHFPRRSPRILGVEQIPRTGSGLPDSRFRASPWDLEIVRQNTNSKFRRNSFCFRSCTLASPTVSTVPGSPLALIS